MPSLFKRLHNVFYPPPPEPELPTALRAEDRADGWQNPWTGIGTARDKSIAGHFAPKYQLPHNELIALFNGSALARKIVVKPAKEMFRRGFEIKAIANTDPNKTRADGFPLPAKPAVPPQPVPPTAKVPSTAAPAVPPKPAVAPPKPVDVVDPDEQKQLEKKLSDLLLIKRMMWGAIWGRLFGGALTLMGAMDGQTPDMPLNEDNISSFEFLNTVDRRYIWVQRYYSDPMSPKYGMPELYLVTNMVTGAGLGVTGLSTGAAGTTLIHETRCIRWDGNETDDITRQQLAGWSFSVLQTVYDTMKKFEHAYDSANALLSDASQAVFKLKGLIDAITSNDKEAVQTRMAMVDMSRSTIKAVLLDADSGEEFKREQTSFAGISDVLSKWETRLSADVDIPHSELFGESPGGLNNNAAGETRKWYDTITSEQTDNLGPLIQRVVNLVSKAADSPIKDKTIEWDIVFRPLWSPTDLEDGQYRLAVAQADNIYLTQGVVTREQVALGRWGGSKFSPNIKVDASELQEAINGKVMQDPYENAPPPTDPSLQGGGTGSSPNSPTPVPVGPNPKTPVAQAKTGPKNPKVGKADEFNPDQPRAANGEFGEGGSSHTSTPAIVSSGPKTSTDFEEASKQAAAHFKANPKALASVQAYTKNGYKGVNNSLAGAKGESEKAAELQGHLKEAPKFEGEVHRGGYVDKETAEDYKDIAGQKNMAIHAEKFWSTSVDEKVARGFVKADAKKGSVKTMMHIQQKSGTALEKVTAYHGEKEVLISPGTKFRVLRAEKKGAILHLHLQEVA